MLSWSYRLLTDLRLGTTALADKTCQKLKILTTRSTYLMDRLKGIKIFVQDFEDLLRRSEWHQPTKVIVEISPQLG